MSNTTARIPVYLALVILVCIACLTGAFAQSATPLAPGSIQVSRLQYDGEAGNDYVSPFTFPEIFNDQAGCTTGNKICNIAGIQASIYIDQFSSVPATPAAGTLSLPSTGPVAGFPTIEPGSYITSSFSSKSEGALMISPNGNYMTYMGYQGDDQAVNVSNSYSVNPNYQLSPNSYTEDPSLGTPITINSASESGSTATITLASPVTYASGAYFTIAGMVAPYTGYNGTWALKTSVTNSSTITLSSLKTTGIATCSTASACGGTATYDKPYGFYDREVALIGPSGLISLTPIDNANSGDNPRAAITIDGSELYTAGNSDSTTASPSTGPNNPGLTIGVRCAIPENAVSYQLGTYTAADRPDESAKQHFKDNNWRGLGIYNDANGNPQLFVAKGSGGNGDDGVFQVGTSLPACTSGGTDTNATITPLFSAPATNPTTGAASPYVPFGFWFANPTTLYVADEGYANTDANGNLIPDPLAGLEKWVNVGGTWTLQYTITAGLNLYQPFTYPGYNDSNNNPILSYPVGLRNMTGNNNGDGTATIYAITANYSSVSSGEPDPSSLVGITDTIAATSLPTNEQFVTLQTSGVQEVFRGVAYVPTTNARAAQTVTFSSTGSTTYGNGPITLADSATSGWPVFYSLVSGPATLSGDVLTITGAGNVVVSASQSGNTDYTAATATQTITVSPASQTITFTTNAPASAAYGSSFTVAATGGASGNPVTFISAGSCTNSGPTYTITSPAGSCSVIANQLGNSNYSAASTVTQTVAATQAATSIAVTSVNPTNEDYGLDSPVTITAVLSYSGSGAAPTGAVTIAGNGPSGYGATTCGAASGNTITCTASYTPTVADGAGTYTESASFAGDSNYSSSSSSQSGNFTINVATASTTVTVDNASPTFGQTVNFTATVSGENGLLKGRTRKNGVKPLDVSGSITWSANTGCGTTPLTTGNPATATCSTSSLPTGSDAVTATYSGDHNHSTSVGSLNETVNQISQTIAFTTNAPASAAYSSIFTVAATGGASGNPVTFTSAGSCSNSGATYTMTSGTGTCSVIANQAGNTNYAAAPAVTETVNATQLSQTVSFTTSAPATAIYNTSFTVAAKSSVSGLAITYTSSGSCTNVGATYTMTSGAGTCSVTATQPGNSDYSAATPVTQSVTAKPATQKITLSTAAPASEVYNGSFTIAATASSGLAVTYSATGVCTNSGPTYTMTAGTGSCTVAVNQAGNTNYSAAATVSETVAATEAAQTVSLTAPSTAAYNSTFTAVATSSAPITATITGNAVCSVSGTTVTMLASTGTCMLSATWNSNGNYQTAYATANVTATKATPVITWATPSPITYSTALGLAQLDASANTAGNFTYSPGSGAIEAAGNDTLTATFHPSSTHYTTATATVVLQVLQQPTTTAITSGNQTVTRNHSGVATSTQTFTVGGYKPSGAVSVVASTGEVCSGTVKSMSGAGSCRLTFSTTGSRTVTATYSGDSNHSSSSTTQSVTITVN